MSHTVFLGPKKRWKPAPPCSPWTDFQYSSPMSLLSLNTLNNTNPLIIVDMANNHNGSIEHGKRIVDELESLNRPEEIKIAIKFQYRNLPDFIHKDYQGRRDLKYVDRFLSTKLDWSHFAELLNYTKSAGFLSACTPFDEFSVSMIMDHGFDILKVASASFTDWSLLEKIQDWNGPIIASTAGATLNEIDRVVTFFKNREKNFALMHCVAAYPTEDIDLLINRISAIKSRYSNIPVGYSTHENPSNTLAGPMALAAGAVILERHYGSAEDGSKLNGYSSNRDTFNKWMNEVVSATRMLGAPRMITSNNVAEKKALEGLRRYAFASRDIKVGEKISFRDVYYAIPGTDNQYQANDFGKYSLFTVSAPILKDQPIQRANAYPEKSEEKVFQIRNLVLRMIRTSGVTIPNNSILEISHHYGIDKFDLFGTSMITVVNREYCKKLLFLFPGQTHPGMYHKKKDETFFLLYGDLDLKLDGVKIPIAIGDTVAISPGTVHEFSSKSGAIIEEVSSSHLTDDSFYVDESISANPNRKTYLQYWIEEQF